MTAHLESKVAASNDFSIGDIVAVERLAIEFSTLDIHVLRAVIACLNDKLLAVLKGNGGLAEEGAADESARRSPSTASVSTSRRTSMRISSWTSTSCRRIP